MRLLLIGAPGAGKGTQARAAASRSSNPTPSNSSPAACSAAPWPCHRVSCFKQVGGYQDSVIEDHLTAMAVYSAVNPVTGNRWSGVYTPDVLAIGEGPTTFTDFFNQQK